MNSRRILTNVVGVMLIAAVMLTFVSCDGFDACDGLFKQESDETLDTEQVSELLAGSWTTYKNDKWYDNITFDSDGTFTDNDGDRGNYFIIDTKIKIVWDGEEFGFVLANYTINGDELRLHDEDYEGDEFDITLWRRT
ncbi:MAG: hypothetical protein FWG45_06060 [Oscillospiraceae bacterium]|nr:hypothetical protein [Oscillospiraceae bacterium]